MILKIYIPYHHEKEIMVNVTAERSGVFGILGQDQFCLKVI